MSDDDDADNVLRATAGVAKHAAERALERETSTPRKRNKRIVQAVIGALVVVGLIGLMLHFWYWSLLLGLVGVVGLYGRHRWRARRALREKPEVPALKARIETEVAPAAKEDAVDDDLAELKARLKRSGP